MQAFPWVLDRSRDLDGIAIGCFLFFGILGNFDRIFGMFFGMMGDCGIWLDDGFFVGFLCVASLNAHYEIHDPDDDIWDDDFSI
jgi:hypothetical protein